MTRAMKWLFLLLASCTVADKTDIGPTIHVVLEAFVGNATDQDTAPSLVLPTGDATYSIDVSITTAAGTTAAGTTAAGTSTSDGFSYSPVTTFSTSFVVGTATLPDSPDQYTNDGYSDATYKRNTPFEIPAIDKGQKLHVHVAAADDRGLAANLVDFSVSLE